MNGNIQFDDNTNEQINNEPNQINNTYQPNNIENNNVQQTVSSSEELMKENTPETVDYNALYNTATNIENLTPNTIVKEDQKTNEIYKEEEIIETPEGRKKSKKALLILALFAIILMGIIIFLFPLVGKLIVE